MKYTNFLHILIVFLYLFFAKIISNVALRLWPDTLVAWGIRREILI